MYINTFILSLDIFLYTNISSNMLGENMAIVTGLRESKPVLKGFVVAKHEDTGRTVSRTTFATVKKAFHKYSPSHIPLKFGSDITLQAAPE